MALSSFVRGLEQRHAAARAAWDPARLLSPWQLRLFQDPAELRIADAGRRSGKTTEFGVELLSTSLGKPNARSVFFATSEVDARELIWDDLWALIEEYQLGATSRKSTIRFPNGSTIRITGAKDPKEAQRRFRGRGYDLVVGDESQLLPWLRDMIQKAIRPALLRGGRRGRLLLGGTPGEIPGMGYWEEICAGQHGEWSVHQATIRDNPVFAAIVEEELAKAAGELGGPQSPVFRREYLRERVMPDESSGLVYRYSRKLNDFNGPRRGGRWWIVVGVDLGSRRDTNGIVVVGVTDAAPGKAWVLDEYLAPLRLPLPQLAKEIRARQNFRLQPVIEAESFVLEATVIDEGGLGGMIADELNGPPYNLGIAAADKGHVMAQSDAINGALLNGTLFIGAESRLAQDLTILRWDPDELQKGRRKLAKVPHSDLEPPLRYSWPIVAPLLQSIRAPARRLTDQEQEDREAEKKRRLRPGSQKGWRNF